MKKKPILYTLGTLADPSVPGITCSDFVARSNFRNCLIVAFDSFEAAADAVEQGRIDCFLVPAAYRNVAAFIQSEKFRLIVTLITKIPPLVFAGVKRVLPAATTALYYQPATESMLNEVATHQLQKPIPVSSNAVACRKVIETGTTATAITNEICAKHFGLVVYQILRPGQIMPFFIFSLGLGRN